MQSRPGTTWQESLRGAPATHLTRCLDRSATHTGGHAGRLQQTALRLHAAGLLVTLSGLHGNQLWSYSSSPSSP